MEKTCYFKIRVERGDGQYKWLGDGHGLVYPTNEKFALYFTDESVKSPEIQDLLRKENYEFIPADDIPRFEWLIYDPTLNADLSSSSEQ